MPGWFVDLSDELKLAKHLPGSLRTHKVGNREFDGLDRWLR